ncbi:MAG TPA: hypothetical protein PK366_07110 [Fibrobacteraceae bacterium]|jgi:hypothetical protein|nr:hypothetical protein [Fibrobacteraceae bacterium]HQB64674.1 hypothetical protein [Fibrobacteraceae bacterium]
MKKGLMVLFAFLMVLSGCAGSKSSNPDQINDALVGFTTSVQGVRWEEALKYVTEDEVYAISDGKEFKPEYQVAARRLKLSTLKQMELYVDGSGRLVGIKKAMDDSNERYKMSEDQAKVGLDLEKREQERIKRRLEEGQKILEEESKPQEPEVEVFTNKLTEEEKRKYGSTKELLPPEEYSDENTQEAEEVLETEDSDNMESSDFYEDTEY